MESVYNHAICKVEIQQSGSVVFRATLRGRYLISKEAAIEEMMESLELRYNNRSTIINNVLRYLSMNVNNLDYFQNIKVMNGNNFYSLIYRNVTEDHYNNYQSLEMWGAINLE